MEVLSKTEQLDDDDKKEYCEMQLGNPDGKKKELERAEGKLSASLAAAKESIATLTDEIKTRGGSVKDVDKTLAGATDNPKEELMAVSKEKCWVH